MIKKIVIVVVMAMMLTGCATKKVGSFGVKFWTDKETGIEYIVYETAYGCGITPRLGVVSDD